MKLSVFIAVLVIFSQVLGEDSQISRASNAFANKLYQQLAKKPGNILVCPISLHIALAVVMQGSGSKTHTELLTTLGLSGTNSDIKESYKSLLTSLQGPNLKIATKLYPANNFALNASYQRAVQEHFLSDVELLDYRDASAAATKINKYVEEHTNNKIHDLISPDSLSDATKLIIVNAVHFQDDWKMRFYRTFDDKFKTSSGKQVVTKMMSLTDEYFDYKEDPVLDAKVLKLNYKNGIFSMLFVLPNNEQGLQGLENKLAHTDLQSLLTGLISSEVDVFIPKFKLELTYSLKEILSNMGIKDMFLNHADLRGMAKGENLYVSEVVQKTFIDVNENGTEAAAATGIGIVATSALAVSKRFYANHPFVFYLLADDLVLFYGRFEAPPTQ